MITGAEGFLGSALTRKLKRAGREVVMTSRCNELSLDTHEWRLDLCRPDHLARLCQEAPKVDTIVHLAGHIEIRLEPNRADPALPPCPGKEDMQRLYRDNVLASAGVLQFARAAGVEHVIFASSQAVYGMPTAELLSEDMACQPLEHYGASKLCVERMLQLEVKAGLRGATVLRFPGLFAEERRSGTVYEFCRMAVEDRSISVQAAYPLPFDVIHRDDVVSAFGAAVNQGAEGYRCFNLGTGDPCSLDILADAIAELVPGCEVNHSTVPQPVVLMNTKDAEEALGWKSVPRRERLSSLIERVKYAC